MTPTRCFLCDKKQEKTRSFHKIPKNPKVRSLWIAFCNLDEATDNVSKVYICSEHFSPNDYIEPRAHELGNRMLLKPDSVPSIRRSSSDLLCTFKTLTPAVNPQFSELPQPSLKIEECDNDLTFDEHERSPKRPRFHEPRYIGEVTTQHLATPRSAKRSFDIAKRKVLEQSSKIKMLKQKNRRLLKKIEKLEDLVNHLKEKKFHL